MPNYQLGKIYKITSPQTETIYIGSTAQPLLCQRMGCHVTNYKRYLNGKLKGYKASFDIIKHGNSVITLIEAFPCNSKDQLYSREQFHMDLHKEFLVNIKQASTGMNRKEYNKEYYQINSEIMSEYQKEYYQNNKDIICQKKKEYRQDNIEIISEYEKEYYQNNKEKLLERKTCACGKEYTLCSYSRHCKSQYHQIFLTTQPTITE